MINYRIWNTVIITGPSLEPPNRVNFLSNVCICCIGYLIGTFIRTGVIIYLAMTGVDYITSVKKTVQPTPSESQQLLNEADQETVID